MPQLYKIRCVGMGHLQKTEFGRFNRVQADRLGLLARKGIFFTSSVLLFLRDNRNASHGLNGFLSKVLEKPALTSDELTRTAIETYGSFPIRLSRIPADCLDEGFVRVHKNIKVIIASWDEGNIPYPRDLEIRLTGDIGNTELAEKILPLLRKHTPIWRQKWDEYPESSILYGMKPKIYVAKVIHAALKEAGLSLEALTPYKGSATFEIRDHGITIAIVKKASLPPI